MINISKAIDRFYRMCEKYPSLNKWSSEDRIKRLIYSPSGKVIEDSFTIEELFLYNKQGANVYFFPNKVSESLSKNFVNDSDITAIRYFFVDADFKNNVYSTPSEFSHVLEKKLSAFPPTYIIFTGYGVHVYWKVIGCSVNDFKSMQQRLRLFLNTDPAVCNPSRCLRLPYTYNVKSDSPILSKIIEYNSKAKYTYNDFHSKLPPLPVDIAQPKSAGRPKKSIVTVDGITCNPRPPVPELFLRFIKLNTKLETLFTSTTGHSSSKTKSHNDFKLCIYLFRYGYSDEQVRDILLNTPKALSINSLTRRLHYVEITIRNAKKDIKATDEWKMYHYLQGDWNV